MRILHVTDIHFNQTQMRWVEAESANSDLVCLTGDFIDSSYACETPIELQVERIKNWLTTLESPVLICSGNHDELGFELETNWLQTIGGVHSDGSVVEINGVVFGCAAFGTSDFSRFAKCQVLLNHEPPAGLKVAKQNGKDFGSRYLTNAIKGQALSLKWLLCGHVHTPQKNTSKFCDCYISNPASNPMNDRPNHHWITFR